MITPEPEHNAAEHARWQPTYDAVDALILWHLKIASEIDCRNERRFVACLGRPVRYAIHYRSLGYRRIPDAYYSRPWWRYPLCWQFWRELPTEMRLRRDIKKIERRMYGGKA